MELTTISAWFIAILLATTSLTYGKRTYLTSHLDSKDRDRRAAISNPRQNCSKWSQWINAHHPSIAHPDDAEHVTKQDLDLFCPPAYGGTVSKIMCNDERGEEFDGNHTDNKVGHTISCVNPIVGATCKMHAVHTVDHCPDLSMKYFCTCSNNTTIGPVTTVMPTTSTASVSGPALVEASTGPKAASQGNAPTVSTSSHSTEHQSVEPPSLSKDLVDRRIAGEDVTVAVGGLLIPWWIILLVITVLLFSINVCISVCLYKHLKQKFFEDGKTTKVHPLQNI